MASRPAVMTVEKLEGARRQLHTAIRLWFGDGDPVPIHALLSAAHEVIHTRFKLKGLRGLMFDTRHIPDSMRSQFGKAMVRAAVFFKHARHDPYGKLRFVPETNEILMHVCIIGLWKMGETIHMDEAIAMLWLRAHRPTWFPLTDEALAATAENVPKLLQMSKSDFFHEHAQLWRSGGLDDAVKFLEQRFASKVPKKR